MPKRQKEAYKSFDLKNCQSLEEFWEPLGIHLRAEHSLDADQLAVMRHIFYAGAGSSLRLVKNAFPFLPEDPARAAIALDLAKELADHAAELRERNRQ